MAFDFFYRIAASFVFEAVAGVWNSLQAGQDEPGERFKSGVAGEDEAIFCFEISNIHRAIEHHHRLIFESGLVRGDVELIFNIADQLLEDIFYRDHTRGRSEL